MPEIWFEKSANQGNPSGQNGLGYLYQQGDGGLPKDLEKANDWFLKSAQQGDSDSQFWLGENLYLSGNKTEGYNWTLKASLNGSKDAQFNLGVMLQNGEGTAKDETLAIIWFIISATNENERSKQIVDNLKEKVSEDQFRSYMMKAEAFVKQNPQAIR
jgi:TPR repeat protein